MIGRIEWGMDIIYFLVMFFIVYFSFCKASLK